MVDTDVLIWYLRGNLAAKRCIESSLPFSVSAITSMELIQGMRSKDEFQRFQKQFRAWNISVIHIDPDISARAVFYVQAFALSHALKLADALIAATAVQHNLDLCTANAKHYRCIAGLTLKTFSPQPVP